MTGAKGRIIAIDYGNKRCGIAVTDPLQMIATALTTIEPKEVIPFLTVYIAKENVEAIVIGEPRHMDNTLSGPLEAIENFVRSLERAFHSVTIKRIDERFTSKMAERSMIEGGLKKSKRKVKGTLDQVSAVLILQDYLLQQVAIKERSS
jgi:putative Holliday junction resolvase